MGLTMSSLWGSGEEPMVVNQRGERVWHGAWPTVGSHIWWVVTAIIYYMIGHILWSCIESTSLAEASEHVLHAV